MFTLLSEISVEGFLTGSPARCLNSVATKPCTARTGRKRRLGTALLSYPIQKQTPPSKETEYFNQDGGKESQLQILRELLAETLCIYMYPQNNNNLPSQNIRSLLVDISRAFRHLSLLSSAEAYFKERIEMARCIESELKLHMEAYRVGDDHVAKQHNDQLLSLATEYRKLLKEDHYEDSCDFVTHEIESLRERLKAIQKADKHFQPTAKSSGLNSRYQQTSSSQSFTFGISYVNTNDSQQQKRLTAFKRAASPKTIPVFCKDDVPDPTILLAMLDDVAVFFAKCNPSTEDLSLLWATFELVDDIGYTLCYSNTTRDRSHDAPNNNQQGCSVSAEAITSVLKKRTSKLAQQLGSNEMVFPRQSGLSASSIDRKSDQGNDTRPKTAEDTDKVASHIDNIKDGEVQTSTLGSIGSKPLPVYDGTNTNAGLPVQGPVMISGDVRGKQAISHEARFKGEDNTTSTLVSTETILETKNHTQPPIGSESKSPSEADEALPVFQKPVPTKVIQPTFDFLTNDRGAWGMNSGSSMPPSRDSALRFATSSHQHYAGIPNHRREQQHVRSSGRAPKPKQKEEKAVVDFKIESSADADQQKSLTSTSKLDLSSSDNSPMSSAATASETERLKTKIKGGNAIEPSGSVNTKDVIYNAKKSLDGARPKGLDLKTESKLNSPLSKQTTKKNDIVNPTKSLDVARPKGLDLKMESRSNSPLSRQTTKNDDIVNAKKSLDGASPKELDVKTESKSNGSVSKQPTKNDDIVNPTKSLDAARPKGLDLKMESKLNSPISRQTTKSDAIAKNAAQFANRELKGKNNIGVDVQGKGSEVPSKATGNPLKKPKDTMDKDTSDPTSQRDAAARVFLALTSKSHKSTSKSNFRQPKGPSKTVFSRKTETRPNKNTTCE